MMRFFSTWTSTAWTVSDRLRRVLYIGLTVAIIAIAVPGYADEFQLGVVYCDLQAGPLTVSPSQEDPLPDGCLIQVIEHVGGGDILRPDAYGNPAGRDRLLEIENDRLGNGGRNFPLVNGTAALQAAGYFVADPLTSGAEPPVHPLYVRIWNAADPAQATYYYQTPLYSVAKGIQQMNFAREQLTLNAATVPDQGSSDVPSEFNVLAGYPNPFNAQATLTYALKEAASVAIDVYDVQGRCCTQLVSGHESAGSHSVHFDATDLPSGTYFAVLQVNNARVSMRRMTLLK